MDVGAQLRGDFGWPQNMCIFLIMQSEMIGKTLAGLILR